VGTFAPGTAGRPWYVATALREKSRHLNRIFGVAVISLATATILAGCDGSNPDQFANETEGEFPVEVVSANFKPRQIIARTYDLKIAVMNTGDEAIPALNTNISLPGLGSTLAFAYRDPQPGLAQPQRPVWVLEQSYPKLAGTVGRGGAATASKRTFNFGAVEAGDTATMIWRVTAVRPGNYKLGYQIAAGLSGDALAVDAAGETPEGILPARISAVPIPTRVNEKGNLVPLTPSQRFQLKLQEESSSP
jgi:hypothetical protein